ncbi:MAG: GWxTD domain-containing protein [Acidobacteriota bacterium]|nr:GWxTD domain-containing protein [Acidobacteriota bacterium]
MRSKAFVLIAVMMMVGVAAEAGVSKNVAEWRRGPEKFLFTAEEEQAWKAVNSDDAAAAFIDLFWARRDPTPGTARNEFREEFLNRVRYADSAFAEKRKRGALSERGQVYLILGAPENGSRADMQIAGNSGLSSASARSAENLVWTWSREAASALGVPKLSVTFNQVIGTDVFVRDTKFGQFSNVGSVAVRKTVVDPNMTVAPEWAAHVGREVLAGAGQPAAAGVHAQGHAGRLILLGDLGMLRLDSSTDPLAALQPVTEFSTSGSLAFVLEYCGGPAGPMKIETKINNLAAAAEVEPMPMSAVAGCAAIPGQFPLSSLKPGAYDLAITTIEPNGARSTTTSHFTIK